MWSDLANDGSLALVSCLSSGYSLYPFSDALDLVDIGPLLQGQMRVAKLKSTFNSLVISLTGLGYGINL